MAGNPVSYERRYRSSLISFVPHLDEIDQNPIPPSSAQKAARRAANKREEALKASATIPKKKKHGKAGSKNLRIKDRPDTVVTPSSRNKKMGSKRTPESTRKFIEKIQEGKQGRKLTLKRSWICLFLGKKMRQTRG